MKKVMKFENKRIISSNPEFSKEYYGVLRRKIELVTRFKRINP